MTGCAKTFYGLRVIALMSALGLALCLTGCHSLVVNDPAQECDHPVKPSPPYRDSDNAVVLMAQAEKIDICRSKLGLKPRMPLA